MTDKAHPKKRARRVKGCYNCSQRRINCDRGTPCQKCIKKGLECLGLGVRYRFNNGVASRGKLAGMSIPVPSSSPTAESTKSSPRDQKPPQIFKFTENKFNALSHDIPSSDATLVTQNLLLGQIHHIDSQPDLRRHFPPIDGQSRFLLSYFSRNIAPAMVAINFVFNGYRDMILPLSEQDLTVRNAIMAASASHLTLKHNQWKLTAAKYHMAAIRGLNQRAEMAYPKDDESLQSTSLCTMVILLIEEMITVGNDFHLLLDMVKNFIQSQGGSEMVEKRPLGKFLIQQIRKMSLYALPFRPKNTVTGYLRVIPRENLDFLYSCLDIHPEYNEIILKLADIIQKVNLIYHARIGDAPENTITNLVQDFLTETSVFNAASPGGHILIWPFFIVGTECSLPADCEFVESQLRTLWGYTGFGNTLYAIGILKQIWQDGGGTKSATHVFHKVKGFIM